MSIQSDELSDFTNETEELNILFEKIRKKEVTSTPNNQVNAIDKSAANTLKITNNGNIQMNKNKYSLNNSSPFDISERRHSLSKIAKLATFGSVHSFEASSFGDDYDEDALFELVERKYNTNGNSIVDQGREIESHSNTEKDILIDETGNASYLQISSSVLEADCASFTESTKSSKLLNKSHKKSIRIQDMSYMNQSINYVNTEACSPELTDNDEIGEMYKNDCEKNNDKEHTESIVEESANILDNDAQLIRNIEVIEGQKDKSYNDYGDYFNDKRIMQQKEDEDYIEWNKKRIEFMNAKSKYHGKFHDLRKVSTIFKGCIIHVNGYTVPGLNEIHKLVITNGGRYLSYLSKKSAVTHIIASRLTPAKMEEFKNCKVVSPKWLLDSLRLNEIQDWTRYSIIKSRDINQSELKFSKSDKSRTDLSKVDNEFIEQQGLSQEYEHSINKSPDDNDNDDDNDDDDDNGKDDDELESNSKEFYIPSEFRDTKIDSNHPDFLKHFFANSRLHHLSTWRSTFKAEFITKSMKILDKRLDKVHMKSMLFYIDFDCFFARVSALSHKNIDFNSTPVCVTHGTKTSDISSCNYAARDFGICNGMWFTDAIKLCPNLVRLNYDFPAYERTSRMFYNYLLDKDENSDKIICLLPISVDECIIEVSLSETDKDSYLQVASKIKSDVKRLTSCNISIGISNNKILSRLCLKKSKPNGVYFFDASQQDCHNFLKNTKVKDLPGVGSHISEEIYLNCFQGKKDSQRLISKHNITLGDLYSKEVTLEQLIKWCNKKTGTKIFKFINGFDNKETIGYRSNTYDLVNSLKYEYQTHNLKKDSISINVNWGIRFTTTDQVKIFLQRLSKELIDRLNKYDKIGSLLTLKIMVKIPNTETEKYLGLGHSEPYTKSSNIGLPTNDIGIISTELNTIFRMIFGMSSNFKIEDIRGIGVKVAKLVNSKEMKQRKIDFKKPLEKNVATKDELNESFFEVQDIEKDVYHCLPSDIQKELRIQHQSEKLNQKFIMKNNIKQNPCMERKEHSITFDSMRESSIIQSDISNSSLLNTQDIYFLKNPDVDKHVFKKELPNNIQEDIINAWKKQEFTLQNKTPNDLKRVLNKMKHSDKLKRRCLKDIRVIDLLQKLDRRCINVFQRNREIEVVNNNTTEISKYSERAFRDYFWKIIKENEIGPSPDVVLEITELAELFIRQKNFRKISLLLSLFDNFLMLVAPKFSKDNLNLSETNADDPSWTWDLFIQHIRKSISDKLQQFSVRI